MASSERTKSESDWNALYMEATEIFSPAAPIDEADLFAGRIDQLRRLMDAVAERGRHAVLYGEKGVGKTSLANIFHVLMAPVVTRKIKPIKKQASPVDTFTSLWRRVFEEIEVQVRREDGVEIYSASDFYEKDITTDDVLREFGAMGLNIAPVIIFDEFDKVADERCRRLMSHTLKACSDTGVRATIILVGVADDIEKIVSEHSSVERNISEIKMPRMSSSEMNQILDKRLARLNMKIDGDARWKIVTLARGLPTYVHALGRDAVRNAIKRQKFVINVHDVDQAIKNLVKDSDQTTTSGYHTAIHSNKKNNRLREVLLAAAISKTDDEGRFMPADMVEPLSAILKKKVEISNFQSNLTAFCDVGRGPILERKGYAWAFKYRFIEPKMQPYVIMTGIADGLLSDNALTILSAPEQPELPIENL